MLDPSVAPTDVTFVFKQGGTEAEVRAHKLILAMGSPVFAAEFYGKLKETKDRIDVEDTTKEAFETMVDYIYGKGVDLDYAPVYKVFAVANMAEKYQINDLIMRVQEVAMEYPVDDEYEAVTIAATAREFGQFEGLRDLFLTRCEGFLKSTLLGSEDIIKFANRYADTDKSDTVLKLIAMMKEEVKNCCENKESCRRGKPIRMWKDIAAGDTVKMNVGKWAGQEGIVSIFNETVFVRFEGATHPVSVVYLKEDGHPRGHPMLLFCKC